MKSAPAGVASLQVGPLTVLLSAAFDRAALAFEAGEDAAAFQATLVGIIGHILGKEEQDRPAP